MNIDRLVSQQKEQYHGYEICITPLDGRCSSLRVEVGKGDGDEKFEETISIYDFVEIGKLLKSGKSMSEINELSLLFLKLMIATSLTTKRLKIWRVGEFPYSKLIKQSIKIN
jgi:hypothetical protein